MMSIFIPVAQLVYIIDTQYSAAMGIALWNTPFRPLCGPLEFNRTQLPTSCSLSTERVVVVGEVPSGAE